ncbi:MAG TPA: hypothetical protein VND22_03370 [Actinomycetota bacterium]|nr:hypothetical protein [Actinomycetota bacterium]
MGGMFHSVERTSFLLQKVAAVVTMAVAFALTPVWGGGPVACAEDGNYVGVVVRLDENREISRCVELRGDRISGLDALKAAGFKVITQEQGGSLGTAVCRIEDIGTDTCDYNAGFWGYFHANPDGSWKESPAGSELYFLRRGDVDAWSWKPALIGMTPRPSLKADIAAICKDGPIAAAGTSKPNFLVPLLVVWVAAASAAVIVALVRRRRRSAGSS